MASVHAVGDTDAVVTDIRIRARAAQVPGHDPVRDILRALMCSVDDPISGGRHKVFGHKDLAIIPQTSTIASHLPRAAGLAYAIDAAKRLFAATGVAREDIAARTASILRNYVFFDAPHLALFCVPDWAGERELADCGQAMQSLMFALTAAGLGSCPQGAAGGYAATTHRILGIPALADVCPHFG